MLKAESFQYSRSQLATHNSQRATHNGQLTTHNGQLVTYVSLIKPRHSQFQSDGCKTFNSLDRMIDQFR